MVAGCTESQCASYFEMLAELDRIIAAYERLGLDTRPLRVARAVVACSSGLAADADAGNAGSPDA